MSFCADPALWPEGFDPDFTDCFANAALVDMRDPDAGTHELHSHRTGQLCAAVEGVVGIELSDGLRMVPVNCAFWVPAEVMHIGMLGAGAKAVFCHFPPASSAGLPEKPAQMMLNRMTVEMLRHLACARVTPERRDMIGRLVHAELRDAGALPVNFAPFPSHPVLRQIAVECCNNPAERISNAAWAKRVFMSERSLSKLVLSETGMSFRSWRTRLQLMGAVNDLARGKPVETVVWKAGYSSPSAFIRMFRRLFGVTPGSLRGEPD